MPSVLLRWGHTPRCRSISQAVRRALATITDEFLRYGFLEKQLHMILNQDNKADRLFVLVDMM